MRTTARLSLCLLGCLALSPWLEGANIKSCPNGWVRYGDKCFRLFLQKLTWAEAELECQSYGHQAHLASVLSNGESVMISRYISSHRHGGHVWIGLHDPRKNTLWTWMDGSIYSYKAWSEAQPDNREGTEHCVELRDFTGFQEWNDQNCRTAQAFICESQL